MALTISGLTPNSGLTRGREFVLIQGTDFNISVDSTDGSPRMEVYFGTELATRVRVRSTTLLDCLTPVHDLGAVDVKVLDLDAVTEDTLTSGFTFARPVLDQNVESEIAQITRALIVELKRQIIDEVVNGQGIDFGSVQEESLSILNIAKVPALILEGPNVVNSGGALHRTGEPWEEVSTDHFEKPSPQDICNFEFSLMGVDDHKVRLLNLMREVITFFRKNPVLKVLHDPSNPSLGYVEIDMRPPMPQDWKTDSRGNSSGLKFFWGRFTLFGITVGHDITYDETEGVTDFPDWQVEPLV